MLLAGVKPLLIEVTILVVEELMGSPLGKLEENSTSLGSQKMP